MVRKLIPNNFAKSSLFNPAFWPPFCPPTWPPCFSIVASVSCCLSVNCAAFWPPLSSFYFICTLYFVFPYSLIPSLFHFSHSIPLKQAGSFFPCSLWWATQAQHTPCRGQDSFVQGQSIALCGQSMVVIIVVYMNSPCRWLCLYLVVVRPWAIGLESNTKFSNCSLLLEK